MDVEGSSNVFQHLLLELLCRSIWSPIFKLRSMQFEDKSRALGRALASIVRLSLCVVCLICRRLRYFETKDGVSLGNDCCPSVLIRGTIPLSLTFELISLCYQLQGKFGVANHDAGKADMTSAPAPRD